MNVTSEMIKRACAAVMERSDLSPAHASEIVVAVIKAMREAALADVPEPFKIPEFKPGVGGLSGPEAYRMRIGYERQRKRIAELEAKLKRINEIVEDASMDDGEARLFVAGVLDGREAILLDGKGGT